MKRKVSGETGAIQASLTPEDLFVLLANVRRVMQDDETALPDTALEAFMNHCSDRIGEAYFRTPRNTVTAFVNLLSVLEQNPGVEWSDLIEELCLNLGDAIMRRRGFRCRW